MIVKLFAYSSRVLRLLSPQFKVVITTLWFSESEIFSKNEMYILSN